MDYTDWDAEFDQDGPWDYDLSADLMHDTPASISNDGHDGDTPTPARNESEKRKEPPQGDGTEDPHETDPKRRGAYFPPFAFRHSIYLLKSTPFSYIFF
jgi:hypothetical protein